MKKKMITTLLVGMSLTGLILTGCAGKENETPAADNTAVEETAADETAATTEEAETADSYDPAGFDPESVYISSEQEPTTDISGCDTFTQVVDKLEDGKGYANAAIGEADVLLISSGTFEWEGAGYAIDSELFIYKEGAPKYIGTVASGGTAYPLSIKDGVLYVGGNHFMKKYTVKDDTLVTLEEAYVMYDTDGNDTYYYKTSDSSFEDYDKDQAQSHFDGLFAELDGVEEIVFDTVGGAKSAGVLPAYEYPGPENFYYEMYKYMSEVLSQGYPEADVSIPCPVIVAMDDSDKSDIKVYGNFWIFNYDLNGDTLENTSGGSYPGCMHFKLTDEGFVFSSMDVVEDGSGFTKSAKEIFGKYYDDFMDKGEDEKLREETRAQIIANYAAANDLTITAYKDYGWDPVTLPEENIDSFYSKLD